jgi:FkbM family methyltransferase
MKSIEALVKRTFLYDSIKQWRVRKSLRQWTGHDQEMLRFYSKYISQGDLCFDVGANVGGRAKIFLKLQASVVAVEPQDRCAHILRTVYGSNPHLTVVQKALGDSEGEAAIMISDADTISSLSSEWIESVRKSGRFAEHSWNKQEVVPLTTLDRLIEQYGTPSFVKIDVEGFEYQVVKGLSQPVRMLSLEFTPEFLDSTFRSIDYLHRLGDIRLNYSVGETMCMALDQWVTCQEMVEVLSQFRENTTLFGDVYVRFLI